MCRFGRSHERNGGFSVPSPERNDGFSVPSPRGGGTIRVNPWFKLFCQICRRSDFFVTGTVVIGTEWLEFVFLGDVLSVGFTRTAAGLGMITSPRFQAV